MRRRKRERHLAAEAARGEERYRPSTLRWCGRISHAEARAADREAEDCAERMTPPAKGRAGGARSTAAQPQLGHPEYRVTARRCTRAAADSPSRVALEHV